jgi:hypothetical protein
MTLPPQEFRIAKPTAQRAAGKPWPMHRWDTSIAVTANDPLLLGRSRGRS